MKNKDNASLSGKHKQGLFFSDIHILSDYVKELRSNDNQIKIGYVSGVWDLHHIGHSLYLEKAKEQCDFLIVGTDSDEEVKQRKGDTRPVIPFDERGSILTHLRQVDAVVIRKVEEPKKMHAEILRPDVLIVSETTKDVDAFTEKMKEAYKGICENIVVFPPQAITSTSARVRLLNIDGAKGLYEQIKKVCEDYFKGGDE